MFYRVTIWVLLSVFLAVSTARAQSDTGRYQPPTAPRNVGPSAPPWTVPGAVCSAATAQKEKPSRGQQRPLIVSPLAHLDQVNAIADISDLNYVVTASNDGTIRVWDSGTADQVGLLFSDYTKRILDVAARPKHGTEVAASISTFGLLDSYVAIFDLTTGQARTLCSGKGANQVRFSPDGRTLAVLDSWTISLWDVNTFAFIRRIVGPQTAIQFYDNSTLAIHTHDSVVLTDVITGKTQTPIPTGVGTAFIMDLSEGLLFHLNKNVVTVWSLPTSTSISTIQLFSDVQFLAFDQDHRKLYASGFESAMGGGMKYIYRLSGAGWKNVEAFGGLDDRVTALAFAGGNLMAGEYYGEVRRFSVRDKFEVEADFGIRAEDITSLATSDGDHYVAAGDRSGIISVWETDSGSYKELDHFNVRKSLAPYFPTRGVGVTEQFISGEPNPPPFLKVLQLAFLGKSTLLAVAYGSGHTLIIDILSGKLFADATISDADLTNFVSIGSSILFVGSAGKIHWWNIETGKSGDFATNLHGLSSLAITPDSKKLIVAGGDGIQLFDAITFSPIGSPLHGGASAPFIAVATSNGSVAVLSETQLLTWDFSASKPTISNLDRGNPKMLAPDMREESSFQVLPSQRRVVKVGSGYGIHIWDSKNPNVLRRVKESFSVTAVAMTTDGKTLLAGGRDGTIGFIDAASGAELGELLAISPLGWYGHTSKGFFDASPLLWDRLFFARAGYGLATLNSSDMFGQYFTPNTIPQILVQKASAPTPSSDISRSSTAAAPHSVIPPQIEITSPRPTVKIGHGVLQEIQAKRTGGQRGPISMTYLRPQPQGSLVESGPRVLDPQVTVTLRATDRGGGLSTCKLFRNSHLIHSFASFPKDARGVELSWVAEMVPGSVEFSAYCFDKVGNRSMVARSTIIGDEKLKGTRRAFIVAVGVGNYERPGLHLNFAASDADWFADTLYSALSDTHSFDSITRIKLCDSEAIDANILAALHRLAGTFHGNLGVLPKQIRDLPAATAQDTVFFYFSGHGKKNGSRYYLLANNFHLDLASGAVSGAVSDLKLTNALDELKAAQVVVILDACESGAALDPEHGRVGPFNFKGFAQMAYDKGIFAISATQSTSDAHESVDLCHAQFTYILVEDGLVAKLADWRPVDQIITTKEWLQYGTEKRQPRTPNTQCVQPTGNAQTGTLVAKSGQVVKTLWDQTPRLFLPDVYSGFDFTIADFRDPHKRNP